jgi:hypothetical protein
MEVTKIEIKKYVLEALKNIFVGQATGTSPLRVEWGNPNLNNEATVCDRNTSGQDSVYTT